MIHVLYHGYVDIEYWEYILSLLYVVVLYLYFARQKNIHLKKNPEYKYFLWGLNAKIFGGVVFSLMYFYYYKGGDTITYFYSAVSMSKLFKLDPVGFFTVLFGENNIENRAYFNSQTGYPFYYVYFDHRTFFVIRLISPLVILAMDSYLITTVVLASLSYIGIWKAFRTFVSYFPELQGKFAIAFLFMPSCIFWGSAILKDTFTLSALCFWIHTADEIFYKRRSVFWNGFLMFLSAVVIIMIKPYIFMVLMPVTLLWLLYFKISRIRNALIKFVVIPIAFAILIAASLMILQRLEGSLGKFSLDQAVHTITISQMDMKRGEHYGEGYFDIGAMDGTWTGVLSKMPVATIAGLFRPFLWESRSLVMAIGALENFWLLALVVITIIKVRPYFFIRSIVAIPIVLMSMVFAILFAYLIGVTTPNFGALVRFKIPLIPLLVSSIFIIRYLRRSVDHRRRKGLELDLGELRLGTGAFAQQRTSRDRIPSGMRVRKPGPIVDK